MWELENPIQILRNHHLVMEFFAVFFVNDFVSMSLLSQEPKPKAPPYVGEAGHFYLGEVIAMSSPPGKFENSLGFTIGLRIFPHSFVASGCFKEFGHVDLPKDESFSKALAFRSGIHAILYAIDI